MSFPVLLNAVVTTETSSGSTFTVNLPTDRLPNDYICIVSKMLDPVLSGWTVVTEGDHNLFYKQADGTEGATVAVTVTPATSFTVRSLAFLVRGARDIAAVISSYNFSTSAPNPLPVTATWGVADNLYVAVVTNSSSWVTYSAGPSGYSTTSVSSYTAYATKESTGASDDPGAFTAITNVDHAVATFVFRGADGNSLFFGSNF